MTIILGALVFAGGLVYASFMEWLLHRYVMHRHFNFFGWTFEYPFRAHTLVHHGHFGADRTYHLAAHPVETQEYLQKKITMAWWNGPIIILAAALPFITCAFFAIPWVYVGIIILAIGLYYCAYEYFHFCMHSPKNRWFERTVIYKWVDKHHLGHHRKMHKNYNVVLPIADVCLGTFFPVRE